MSRLPKLIVVVGPTGSGKSGVAIALAKKFNGEVVCADSRQIYKGMLIGTGAVCQTAKIKNAKLKMRNFCVVDGVRHYMLGIVEPWEQYNVAHFKRDALRAAGDIIRRGKLPIMVGGTNLWIKAVVDNLEIPQVPPNRRLRVQFENDSRGAYNRLLKLDPDAEQFVQKDNPRRIIRALEVCFATGKPFSKLRARGKPLFDVLALGVDVPRSKLYQMIDARVDKMLRKGLYDEVESVVRKIKRYFHVFEYESEKIWRLPAMTGIGYREWRLWFELRSDSAIKRLSDRKKVQLLREIVQRIKYDTHGYVRQQMTWLKRDKMVQWVKSKKEAVQLAQHFLE